MHGDSDSKEVEADVVVTARGLSPLATGGMDLVFDERPVDLAVEPGDLPNAFERRAVAEGAVGAPLVVVAHPVWQ